MKRLLWAAFLFGVAGLAQLGATPAAQQTATDVRVHTYYVAAEETEWDYAPLGMDIMTGHPFEGTSAAYTQPDAGHIGHIYRKAIYREYTDATFATRKPRAQQDEYLGLLGPILRAEVGDTIKVVFKNNLSFAASIHPHGVFYAKSSEGAPYADGTSGKQKTDDAVLPGHRVTYVWKVPPRAGPGPMDGSSIVWMYHSHVDEVSETNAGLVGAIVVARRGMTRSDGTAKDVDREFVTYFSVVDENVSPYLKENVGRYTGRGFRGRSEEALEADEEFHESNLMHSINGYVYGNQPGLEMRRGERVRWYVLDLGTEVDLHSPHWHGKTVKVGRRGGGTRVDTISLLPASMVVADMTPDAPGTWLFHCHVNDHIAAGMATRYRVTA